MLKVEGLSLVRKDRILDLLKEGNFKIYSKSQIYDCNTVHKLFLKRNFCNQLLNKWEYRGIQDLEIIRYI